MTGTELILSNFQSEVIERNLAKDLAKDLGTFIKKEYKLVMKDVEDSARYKVERNI